MKRRQEKVRARKHVHIYEGCGLGTCATSEVWMVEWMKRNTLRWFGHIERMEH